MNLYDLIDCYDGNRDAIYLTDIPEWLKELYGYIFGIILFSFLYYCSEVDDFFTTFSIGGAVIIIILYLLHKNQSKYLLKKYDGNYGLELKNIKKWNKYYTRHIQKEKLRIVLGNHVSNEPLMARLKTQLQGNISKNKKSIQISIPVTGFITVIVAAYLGFNLRYFESSFKENSEKAYSTGTDFLVANSMLIGTILVFLILYKPIIEIWLNRYKERLEALLSLLETIEVEYLATKTKGDEIEILDKAMD